MTCWNIGMKLLRHSKNSDDATYDYVLKDVSKFIKKIESMTKNINLSLLNEFFELSPVDYAKNYRRKQRTCNWGKKKAISTSKDRPKKMSETEKKKKNTDETLDIIKKFLITVKMLKDFFRLHQKLIKKIRTKDWRKYFRENKIKKRKDCCNWKKRKKHKQ